MLRNSGMPQGGETATRPNLSYSDTEQNRQTNNRNPVQLQQQLPPEVLTEFQKFIVSTNGQSLPIYGTNWFRHVPSTFAPLDMVPVPPDYVLGPGDELRVRVWGQVTIQANVQVDRAGDIYLPQVGQVHVASIPFSALDGHLRAAIGRVFRNFDLTVNVGQIRSIQVYVTGEARRPGMYTVSSLSSLVDALFASGGPSVQGSMRHIELRRGSGTVTEFDLYELMGHGDKSKDVKLMSGDVIFIPAVGPQVALTGSVRNPAIYELRADETLKSLLTMAGGTPATTSESKISIERIDDHSERHAMEVAYDGIGLATQLADGDLIRIYSILPKYKKTVTLRGNVANPGRYAWHEGMHISDLIPDRESLITRSYWWKRTQLGLPAPDYELVPGLDEMRQPRENRPYAVRMSAGEGNPYGANQTGAQQPGQSDTRQSQAGSWEDQSGSLGGQQYQPGLQQDQLGQQQLGQQQDQTGATQNLRADQRNSSTTLASSGSASSLRGHPAKRGVSKSLTPEIDWDYAVVERLDPNTLKSSLVPFDLGKLILQHDTSQDIELQAGDSITIFSEDDIRIPLAEQTKRITLDGEFAHAGVYTARPDETLRQLVERAGGLTSNAYLYGSEFTRESTRALQQARIDEYVEDLGRRILRSNIAASASSSEAAASSVTALGSERELLARLQQIHATGRIVLEFKPNSIGVERVPEIAMQDGDHFIVPSVPASVNVVGAVYNQNSFLYTPERKLAVYLNQAGGPNRDADKKHAFVIRASGEVISSDREKGPWGGKFANLRMYPGDTLVIPDKTFKPSTLRQVMEWSQLFSTVALSAAALNSINK